MTNNPGNNAGLAFSNAVADAVERAGTGTVMVNARRRLPLSGLLIGPNLVLTASHGVEREEDIQVVMQDGSQGSAALAGRDRGTDLAVLRLQTASTQAQSVRADQAARVGHLVVAVGRPSTEGVQASLGLVTGIGGGLRTHGGGMLESYIVTDAVPYPGFSGGPLADLAGGVLGINTSGLVQGSSLAIPAGLAWEIGKNLAEHGHIRRGFLGIRSQVVDIPAAVKNELGRAQDTGLLIIGAENEGPGAQGGLMVGDILVGLNGQPVANHDDLLMRLTGDVVGKPLPVEVLRGGQLKTVQVTVGERE